MKSTLNTFYTYIYTRQYMFLHTHMQNNHKETQNKMRWDATKTHKRPERDTKCCLLHSGGFGTFYVSMLQACCLSFVRKMMTNIWTTFLFNSACIKTAQRVKEFFIDMVPTWDYLHSVWQWQMSTSVVSLFPFSSLCAIRTPALCWVCKCVYFR